MKHFLVSVGVLAFTMACGADDWPQWRGPHRDGNSTEKGLLKDWPKAGPKLVWTTAEAGSGYSTPAVVGERLYLLGNEGIEKEFVEALAVADGKRLWLTPLGKVGQPNQRPSYPAARSTPTVDGEVLYALSSEGDLECVETGSGKVRWHKNLQTDFKGKPGVWAYAESPLIDGDTLVCTPGGREATLLGLNKKTGAVVWQCATPEGDEAAYSSAIVVEAGGVKQYVQLLQKGLVGVGAGSGKLLWRYSKAVSKYDANIPTPLASGALIYTASAGTGGGVVMVKPRSDGMGAEEAYFESKMPTAIGGVIKVDDYFYGTTGQAMLCVEFATGKIKWEDRAIGPAALCLADGRLYLHGENGEVALVEPSTDGYRERGRFTPPGQPGRKDQMEKPWAFPVVANGRLYLRDHGRVWCYDVRSGAAR